MNSLRNLSAVALVSVSALAACGSSGEEVATSASGSTTAPAQSSPEASAPADGAGTPVGTPTGSEAASAEASGASTAAPGAGSVTVAVGATRSTVTPTDVYCSGSPGHVRHLVAKTGNRPPLVEVDGTRFVLVKLDERGAPHKAERPTGVRLEADSVVFSGAQVGASTLEGTLRCTTWEN